MGWRPGPSAVSAHVLARGGGVLPEKAGVIGGGEQDGRLSLPDEIVHRRRGGVELVEQAVAGAMQQAQAAFSVVAILLVLLVAFDETKVEAAVGCEAEADVGAGVDVQRLHRGLAGHQHVGGQAAPLHHRRFRRPVGEKIGCEVGQVADRQPWPSARWDALSRKDVHRLKPCRVWVDQPYLSWRQ